jgi:uncharacterized delta-60 repeat protein
VAIQDDGKIVVAGVRFADDGSSDFVLSRYDVDGKLDPAFSDNGRQVTNFGGRDEANDVALQDDGKIVAAGMATSEDDTTGFFALARYLGN